MHIEGDRFSSISKWAAPLAFAAGIALMNTFAFSRASKRILRERADCKSETGAPYDMRRGDKLVAGHIYHYHKEGHRRHPNYNNPDNGILWGFVEEARHHLLAKLCGLERDIGMTEDNNDRTVYSHGCELKKHYPYVLYEGYILPQVMDSEGRLAGFPEC